MKISYEWLREYVNTKIRADKLSSILTMIGHEVTAVEKHGKDFIFDVEVTPNRADCLSYLGLAREVAAITRKAFKLPDMKIGTKAGKIRPVSVAIEDKDSCLRYSARVIRDVKVGPSPKWLIKRIEAMGLRPVNNIVDITNFVLFETGQPLHAFDLDKITGNKIIIRNALPGEKIITIDTLERKLKPHILVIADKEGPVAIAGIMGGQETEVTEKTKNILLESAYFSQTSIRKAILSLGLSSDSSYRFERGVDISKVVEASDRASFLISKISKARIGALTDVGKKQRALDKIILRPQYLNKILGLKLSANQINDILTRLGFKVKGRSALEIAVPDFRNDITREADLIEEVARIYGYENIMPSPPASIIVTDESPARKNEMQKIGIVKDMLVASGFNEVVTHSLTSRQAVKDIDFSEEGLIDVENPLSKEQEVMRQSLLPGMLKVVSHNISRQINRIKIFELSNIYFLKESAYNEELFLGIAIYDKSQNQKESLSSGLFQIKGAVIALCERLGIVADLGFESTTHPAFATGETIALLSGTTMLGTIGKVKTDVLGRFDIKGDLYAAEINFKTIEGLSNLSRFYKPLPRFPFSYRDISFSVNKSISYKEITGLIKGTGSGMIEEIECLSEYHGKEIPKMQRGLAIRIIYRLKEKTLTEEEINRVDTDIRSKLTDTFNVTLR